MGNLARYDFTQANVSPLPNPPWTGFVGTMQILSNQAAPTAVGSDAGSYYNARGGSSLTTWPADQYVQGFMFCTGGTAGSGVGPCLILRNNTSTTYYRLSINAAAGNNIQLQRFVAGVFTDIWDRAATFVQGALLRMEIYGSTIRVFYNGSQVGADTVDTSIATGIPGIGYSGGSGVSSPGITFWEAGAILDPEQPRPHFPPIVLRELLTQRATVLTTDVPATGAQTFNGTVGMVGIGALADAPCTLLAPSDPASFTGAGVVGPNATLASSVAANGGGVVTQPAVIQQAPVTPAGAGAVSNAATQGAIDNLAGAGAVSNVAMQIETAVTSLTGAGVVTNAARELAPVTITGAGTLTDAATQGATDSMTGAGVLTNGNIILQAPTSPTGAGTLTALATQLAIVNIAGAGSVTALATQLAIVTMVGTGVLNASAGGSANLGGAGTMSAVATESVIATLTGAGALASPSALQGANVAPTGSGVLADLATQGAIVTVNGVGMLSATGSVAGVITVIPVAIDGSTINFGDPEGSSARSGNPGGSSYQAADPEGGSVGLGGAGGTTQTSGNPS
jgi:hypothetical protein